MRGRLLPAGVLLLLLIASHGGTFKEEFATNPLSRGWLIHGDSALFQWLPGDQRLAVTWDSSRSNSYFHRPLGVALTEKETFGLELDLLLTSLDVGLRPDKPFTFELAFGFHLLENATQAEFRRGTGQDASNLLELDYFPAQGVVASTISPTAISKEGVYATSFNYPFDLPLNQWLHIALDYDSNTRTIKASIFAQGQLLQPIEHVVLPASFSGFQFDTVAISSYSDDGAGGSLLATGQIDNLAVTFPDPPVIRVRPGRTAGEIHAWMLDKTVPYRFFLERTSDFEQWSTVTSEEASGSIPVLMLDPQSSEVKAFYRIRGEAMRNQ